MEADRAKTINTLICGSRSSWLRVYVSVCRSSVRAPSLCLACIHTHTRLESAS